MLSKGLTLTLQWLGAFGMGMAMAWCIHNEYYSYSIVLGIAAIILVIAACVTHEKR